MANSDGNGDGQRRWQLQWLTVMDTAMANGKGNSNSNGRRQHNRYFGGYGWRQLQWQWSTATAMAMGDGNSDGDKVSDSNGDGDGNCNGNGHGKGNKYKGRLASSCAGDVQCCGGRGNTLPPPPWTQRKVHSPALRHGGDTAKSVCSPSRGRVPDSLPWMVFVYFLQLLFSLLSNPLFTPHIIQVLKNPVSPLTLYLLHSSKNPVSLLTIFPGSYCTFCQGKPGQGLQLL